MIRLPTPQGILFDRGGVLVQSRPSNDRRHPPVRFAAWMAEHFGVDADRWLEAMKPGNDGYDLGRLTPIERLQLTANTYDWQVPANEVARIIEAEYNAYYMVSQLDRGIDTLRVLRQIGLPVGLCSNASPNEEGGDALLGLHTYLPVDGYSHHLGVKKPDPEAYIRAAALLGLEPAQCWFVDDGGDGSLQGATALGMTAIYYEHHSASGVKNPDLVRDFTGPVILGLRDLPPLIARVD